MYYSVPWRAEPIKQFRNWGNTNAENISCPTYSNICEFSEFRRVQNMLLRECESFEITNIVICSLRIWSILGNTVIRRSLKFIYFMGSLLVKHILVAISIKPHFKSPENRRMNISPPNTMIHQITFWFVSLKIQYFQ